MSRRFDDSKEKRKVATIDDSREKWKTMIRRFKKKGETGTGPARTIHVISPGRRKFKLTWEKFYVADPLRENADPDHGKIEFDMR